MKISTAFTVVSLTLLTSFSTSLCAAEEKSEATPAMKLIELMNFTKMAKTTASTAFAPVLEQLKGQGLPEEGIKEVSKAVDNYFSKIYNSPELMKDIAKAYESVYTKEEIEELIAFYSTPIGKKSLETMPQIMEKSAAIGQKYAEINQAEFEAVMQAIMAKHMPKPE
jgi:uncharacterized protein